MRRLLPLLLITTFLVACAHPGELPPDVVMEKMINANRTLQSARFAGTAEFFGLPIMPLGMQKGDIAFEGAMQDAGNQLELTVNAQGNRSDENGTSMEIIADIIVLDSQEVYLKLKKLSFAENAANDPAAQLSSLLGDTWWSLTPTSTSLDSSLSPDPRYLRMQSETVRIEKDNGIKQFNGTEVYVYDVRIDPEKFRAFMASQQSTADASLISIPQGSGTFWIDASSFYLLKARWDIQTPDGANINIEMAFTDHGQPVSIAPPEQSFPFPANGSDSLYLTD